MKNIKKFIQFKSGDLESQRLVSQSESNEYESTLSNENAHVYTFLPDANKVIFSVSDVVKQELGADSNIISEEPLSNFPLGWNHQNLTQTVDMLVGKNSSFETFEDCVNYAAALVEANSSEKITIVRMTDKKFNNKIYYVISNNFSNSIYLNIPNVVTGDAEAGVQIATDSGSSLELKTDGIAI